MDYNLTRIVQSNPEYNIDQALPYGDMPSDLLVSRFEETDMGSDEAKYNDYARNTLTDWAPDPARFEHEMSRGGVNRSAGKLQLQYYGHRGEEEAAHPEMFLGFGPEDEEPRGINTEPDFKKYKTQQDERMRFVRFTAENDSHITGGGRSEDKVIADNQIIFKDSRSRLRIFNRQLDGRREGLRRTYTHVPDKRKVVHIQSYGDCIKDHALTPISKSNIVCRRIIRDSAQWRCDTQDQDVTIAKYSMICKRGHGIDKLNKVLAAQDSQDAEFGASDQTKTYHAVGVLMSNIVKGKAQTTQLARESDMDLGEAKVVVARKCAPIHRDIQTILSAVNTDNRFGVSDSTRVGKCATPADIVSRAEGVSYNLPHSYVNAEIIYKCAQAGGDLRKVKDLVITDSRTPLPMSIPGARKCGQGGFTTGASLATDYDSRAGGSMRVHNYRAAKSTPGILRSTAGEDYGGTSVQTQVRKPLHTLPQGGQSTDAITTMSFDDNKYQDRHARPMGSKYMVRYMDRENTSIEV
jgi:hypothetical protein